MKKKIETKMILNDMLLEITNTLQSINLCIS